VLELSPDLENFEFVGNEEITLQVDEPVNEITLHQNEVFIISAVYKNIESGALISVNETNYNNKLNTLKFIFDSKLPVGRGQLILKFRGILNNDMAGFYRSSYTDASGNKKFMASTQFESLDARRYHKLN
jgi:aminopeptidase N